ncbi:MAG: hypothetical protein HOP28_03900 [Gemmatimonadales bacterium]|nr:hypothetical protein [Gemmatimonadales bacterium]
MIYQVLQAYVRPQLSARVVQALIDAGCTDLFFTETRRVVSGVGTPNVEYSVLAGQKVEAMVRIEVAGTETQLTHWTQVIKSAGSTQRHGDGTATIWGVLDHFHLSVGPEGAGT